MAVPLLGPDKICKAYQEAHDNHKSGINDNISLPLSVQPETSYGTVCTVVHWVIATVIYTSFGRANDKLYGTRQFHALLKEYYRTRDKLR